LESERIFPRKGAKTLSKKPEPVQFLCELCAFAGDYPGTQHTSN
jgi:hypothetical protein